MKPSLSIVIPCYNEQTAIAPVLFKILKLTDSDIFKTEFAQVETIVVDDGSDDGSSHELAKFKWVKAIRHDQRCGYGAALKSGFSSSRGDVICFLDMDDSYDPLNLLDLWAAMKTKNYDVVYGNRLHDRQGMPYTRRVGNLFFSHLTRHIRGGAVSDVASGFRLFKRDQLPHFYVPENGLDYSLALTLKLLSSSLKLTETPIRYNERIGQSKLSVIGDGFKFLFTYRSPATGDSLEPVQEVLLDKNTQT